MKRFLILFFISISTGLIAQKTDYNTSKGYIAEGYDVVSYFTESKPLEGKKKYQTTHDGVKFKFASEKNLTLFRENPTKYIPEYGGFCAYAIAKKKTKMSIDAQEYEVRDGKLYLFYSSWFSSKLKNWQEEDTPKLQKKGDKNWEELKNKKQ